VVGRIAESETLGGAVPAPSWNVPCTRSLMFTMSESTFHN
jgi:hypothetical protein